MLARTVPAPAGLQPVKLGSVVFCDVSPGVFGDDLYGRLGESVGWMQTSSSLKTCVSKCCCCTVLIDVDGLLATCFFLLLFLMVT
jgi:hypothetical protein